MHKLNRSDIFKNQVVRFIFSAGVGFLVDIFAFYLFYKNLFEQPTYQVYTYTVDNYTLSLAISFFMGVVVNFLITRYMVFTESTSSSVKQFTRFCAVATIGFFANLIIINFFIRVVGMYPPLARIATALSLFFASFFVHKFFSFSIAHKRRHAATATADNGSGN